MKQSHFDPLAMFPGGTRGKSKCNSNFLVYRQTAVGARPTNVAKIVHQHKIQGQGTRSKDLFAFKCFDIITKNMCVFWFGCYRLLTLCLIVFVVKSFTCINCVQLYIMTAKDVLKSFNCQRRK